MSDLTNDNELKKVDVNALFLGPKSENFRFFKEMMTILMDEHIFWRRNFQPEDKAFITHQEQQTDQFLETENHIQESLFELSNRLRAKSVPWFSPRYMGHMNTDVLMPAVLGYMATILYNPNNCAYEASPATTEMELEAGHQLGVMLGYEPDKTWGHITSGGTVANFESIWLARNLKSMPFGIREVAPQLTDGMDDWTLGNLTTDQILELMDQAHKLGVLEDAKDESVQSNGVGPCKPKLLVPESKHYSWLKSADIFGIGRKNIVMVPVKDDYRMDMDALRKILKQFVKDKTPVLALVSVIGSTEEGAIDQVHEVVKIRRDFEKRGLSFYYHLDAAFAGYARSMFLDENDRFMEFDEVNEFYNNQSAIEKGKDWLTRDVYESFKAMPEADSITLDCHKMGYLPYSSGAIAVRDKRMLTVNSYESPYLDGSDAPPQLGQFIMEGSKAGATAAAVWVAHRVCPLNAGGYGQILGRSMEAAFAFYSSIVEAKPFKGSDGAEYQVISLCRPDFNTIVFALNRVGNTDLEEMNQLNEKIYNHCSYVSGPLYHKDFITSKTSFTTREYGNTPVSFLKECGIPASEWERLGTVFVLRSCVLSPFLAGETSFENCWNSFTTAMEKVLGE